MRIIAGRLRGTKLLAPKTKTIRATSSRLRETIFNVLVHHGKNLVHGATALDLFAGTGAMGIEAISRGARFCVFVDNSKEGYSIIQDNLMRLGLIKLSQVWQQDATNLKYPSTILFDLVFIDPPYRTNLVEASLLCLTKYKCLNKGATVVIEKTKSSSPNIPPCFKPLDIRKEGRSFAHIFRYVIDDHSI